MSRRLVITALLATFAVPAAAQRDRPTTLAPVGSPVRPELGKPVRLALSTGAVAAVELVATRKPVPHLTIDYAKTLDGGAVAAFIRNDGDASAPSAWLYARVISVESQFVLALGQPEFWAAIPPIEPHSGKLISVQTKADSDCKAKTTKGGLTCTIYLAITDQQVKP